VTQAELLAIGRLEGRVGALESQTGRIEHKLDDLAASLERDRQSVAEFRIEDLERQIAAAQTVRRSMRPKAAVPKNVVTWVLIAIGGLATAVATWLATG
jgi:hypothetical protein